MSINWHTENFPKDGTQVLLRTHIGIVSAWFDHEESQWVCYDDMFSLDEDDNTIEAWAFNLDIP